MKTTKNQRGARKMLDHGQRVRFWMLSAHSLDSLWFAKSARLLRLTIRRYAEAQGITGNYSMAII